MYSIKHTGLYVKNLEIETNFYINVFGMLPISTYKSECNYMLDDLFKKDDIEIYTSKLITQAGKIRGTGDMIELIKVNSFQVDNMIDRSKIFSFGMMHIGMEVDDIYLICDLIIKNGGRVMTQIHEMDNGNKCAFANDPEGNWIELIQNKK